MHKTEDGQTPTPTPQDKSPGSGNRTEALNDAKPLRPGQIVEKYKILSLIGRGGTGSVYKVEQILLKKPFALKTLNAFVGSDSTWRRFQNEGLTASRLDHPNLVRAVDFGMIDRNQPFLVMEYVQGENLAQYLKHAVQIPVETALQIFIPICTAVAYAHGKGVIHRDIKPSNIVLVPSETNPGHFIPKVVDFGIAKLQETDGLTLTKTGEIFGTPLYMSPEQCIGVGVDNRSDIYSLGCVLFEALTGAAPFGGQSALETLMQHGTAKAPTLKEASLGLEFPEALEKIVAKMLAKDPLDRYQDLMDVGNDLLLVQAGDVTFLHVIAKPERTRTENHERHDWSQLTLGLALGLVCGFAFSLIPVWYPSTPNEAQKDRIQTSQVAHSIVMPNIGTPSIGALQDCDFFHCDLEDVPAQAKDILYHFPKRKYDLGTIYWWTQTTHGWVNANGDQRLPKGATLVLHTAEDQPNEMLSVPSLWGKFHSDDLSGVIIKLKEDAKHILDPTRVNYSVISATQQEKLRLLSLNNLDLSNRAFKNIGDAPHLEWLELSNVSIGQGFKGDENRTKKLNGSDLASIGNICNLDTLTLAGVSSLAPALNRLRSGRLRQLCIIDCGLTMKDVALIKELRSLETLVVHDPLGEETIAQLNEFAALPNLKRLCVDFHDSRNKTQTVQTVRFPKLERLIINVGELPQNSVSLFRKSLKLHLKLPPNFDYEKALTVGVPIEAQDWMDPLKNPPTDFQ